MGPDALRELVVSAGPLVGTGRGDGDVLVLLVEPDESGTLVPARSARGKNMRAGIVAAAAVILEKPSDKNNNVPCKILTKR